VDATALPHFPPAAPAHALHPDRAAGLGFLAIYPGIFNGLVFALSSVVASSMVKALAVEGHSPQTVWLALAVWLGICLVLVLGPLLVFAWPLYRVRERALLEYGRLATQHHIAFDRKWIKSRGMARSSWDRPIRRRHRTSTQP